MNKRYEIQDNKLILYPKGNALNFPVTIKDVLEFEKVLVVRIYSEEKRINDNVFGVSDEGKLLWQIEPVEKLNVWDRFTYIGKATTLEELELESWNEFFVDFEHWDLDNIFVTYNTSAYLYYADAKTGKLLGRQFMK